MAIPGEALDDPLYFSGNSVAVKPRSNAREVLNQLIADGAEHHFSVGYDVTVDDVVALGRRLEIPVKVY
jgi:L-arabinose isomerase